MLHQRLSHGNARLAAQQRGLRAHSHRFAVVCRAAQQQQTTAVGASQKQKLLYDGVSCSSSMRRQRFVWSRRRQTPRAAAARSRTHTKPKQQIVFDMDGTLTEAHIDFADMRARTGIPTGWCLLFYLVDAF